MKYTLEKYKTPSSRYTCPGCGQRRRFTRYIYTDTGQHVADHVGRCDRQDSCGYHFTPRMYFEANPSSCHSVGLRSLPKESCIAPSRLEEYKMSTLRCDMTIALSEPSYLPMDMVEQSWTTVAEPSHFEQYLYGRYDRDAVTWMLSQYHVGGSQLWEGASVFWQIDEQMRVRTGKVMLYDPATGRRVREPHARISWMHRVLGLEGYHLSQCLYGLHLMHYDDDKRKPIAVTESEKTAMLASLLMPEYIWMATGGKEMLTAEKMMPLRGRPVVLYPDQGGYGLWSRRAMEASHVLKVDVCDLLEGQEKGVDLADFLCGTLNGETA